MGSADQSQRGASAVEFAVIAPLFIALLFGIVEFGMILYTNGMLAHAGREGARFGVVYCNPRRSDSDIQNVVQGYLNRTGLTSTATIAITPPLGSRTTGTNLNVTVNYTYRFMVLPRDINDYLSGKMSNLNLTAATVMRME